MINRLKDQVQQCKIIVVDDEPLNAELVEGILDFGGFLNVKLVTNSSLVMDSIKEFEPDIVLLDINMPKPNGFDILAMLEADRALYGFLPVLVFTADGNPETKTQALEAGASDFLTKPGDANEILLRVRNFLLARMMYLSLQSHNEILDGRVRARTAELSLARREAIGALARAAEFRDDDTGKHTQRVGDMSAEIAFGMGESDTFVEAIRLVAPLHDVGKIGIPDSVLLKPGRLTDDELKMMRKHTAIGELVFTGCESPLMKLSRDIALSHHERWDGSGYPHGISGENIPLAARIVAVADVYDALTHERPYKKAWSHDEAVAEIIKFSGSQFDPRVVDAFVHLVGRDSNRWAA